MDTTENNDNNTNTFEVAREKLYSILDGWTYCSVLRDATIPSNGVDEHGAVTYYHFTCKPIVVGKHCSQPPTARVWCKKNNIAQIPLTVGPVLFNTPDQDHIPRAKDIVMGRVTIRRARDNQPRDRDRYELLSWYPAAGPLLELFKLVCHGTHGQPSVLAHKLRFYSHGAPVDDIWALVKLVLFKNVDLFATLTKHKIAPCGHGREMLLSTTPLLFVHKCATILCDASIWRDFCQLVPDADQLLAVATNARGKTHNTCRQTNASNTVSISTIDTVCPEPASVQEPAPTRASAVVSDVMNFLANAAVDYQPYQPYQPYDGYDAFKHYNDGGKDHQWQPSEQLQPSFQSPSLSPSSPPFSPPNYSPMTPPSSPPNYSPISPPPPQNVSD